MLTHWVIWILAALQGLIAGCGGWQLRHKCRRAQAHYRSRVQKSQALLGRLAIATRSAGISCWEYDWSTGTSMFHPRRLTTDGFNVARAPDDDLLERIHPEDQDTGRKAILEALARSTNEASFRYRIVLPDKSIRHVEASAHTHCNADGNPVRSVGVSWDVTQQVETAERAAHDASVQRELLERLSVATQAAGLECFEFDWRTQQLVWMDDHGAVASSEANQKAPEPRDLIPEDLERAKTLAQEAAARGDPMVSFRCRRRAADGSLRTLQSYHRLFYDSDGDPVRTLGANIDITDLHKRQVELETLSVRFAIATHAANAGVWEWNERTGENWWNETQYAIYGLPVASSPPSHTTRLGMIHPDDLPMAQSNLNRILNGLNQAHVQFRLIRPDGRIAHLDAVATRVTDAAMDRRVIGITLDVTERVAAEERERQLQKQLREASHQSGMAEVATGVLHNVGNVLNSLGVSSSTLRARLRTSPFDRVARVAAMLDTNRDSLRDFFASDPRGRQLPQYLCALRKRLSSDMDDLGHELDAIDSHIQYLREIVQAQQSFTGNAGTEEPVNIRELLATALTLKGQELRDVQITRDIPDLPEVWTDRYKLLQIIVNFVGNASDAVAESERNKKQIAVRARLTGDWLEIAIEDHGVGIAADLLERVWEFGFTTKTHGHGFGLHSAAVAAQQLGGSVAANSAGPGQGACFSIKIPARTATSGACLAASS
ncbi:MAG TPA: PAS domain-containing protein [Steroidobacteraceae bacterium]